LLQKLLNLLEVSGTLCTGLLAWTELNNTEQCEQAARPLPSLRESESGIRRGTTGRSSDIV